MCFKRSKETATVIPVVPVVPELPTIDPEIAAMAKKMGLPQDTRTHDQIIADRNTEIRSALVTAAKRTDGSPDKKN